MALAQSLGTFENFKKHPVDGYVGSYAVPHIVAEDYSQAGALINALSGAADTLIDKEHAAEEYRKEYGLTKAQELINSTSEKDRLELHTRTLLQNAGMIDLSDNYYAVSLIEKNTGETAAKAFTRDYMHDMEVNQTYKKTREEQLDDYHTKRREFFSEIKDRRQFSNPLAFDTGFNEGAPLDEANVDGTYTKWMDQTHLKEAGIHLSDTLKQLSLDLIWDTEQDGGETKNAFQAALNEAMLANIPPEQIAKMLEGKIHDYLLSGKYNPKTLDAMKDLAIGVWHTNDENFGKPMTFGEFMGTSIQQYYKAFKEEGKKIVTRHQLELLDTAREKSRISKQSLYDWYESLPQEDKEYVSPHMAQTAQWGDNQREALARQSRQRLAKQNEVGNDTAVFSRQYNFYKAGILPDKTWKDAGFSSEEAATSMLMYAYNQGEITPEDVLQLLNTPTFSGARAQFKSYAVGQLGNITTNAIESAEGKEKAINRIDNLYRQQRINPSLFEDVYGSDISSSVFLWKTLAESQGAEGAIHDFAAVQTLKTDKQAWAGIESKAKDGFASYGNTLEIRNLDEDPKAAPTLGIDVSITPGMSSLAWSKMAVLVAAGRSPEEAAALVGDYIKDNYWAYGYGGLNCAIPKAIIDGNGHDSKGDSLPLSPLAYDHGITKEIHNFFQSDDPALQASFQLTWDNSMDRLKVYAAQTGQTLYLSRAQIKAAAENEQEYMDSVDYEEQRTRAYRDRNLGETLHPYEYDETGANLLGGTD